jgi:hypothetical protein
MNTKKDRNLRLVDGKWYLDITFKGRRRSTGSWAAFGPY